MLPKLAAGQHFINCARGEIMYEADYLAEYAAKSDKGMSLPKLLKRWWLVVLIAILAFVLIKQSPGDFASFLTGS